MLKISQLYIYPVKSLAGIAVTEATVTDRGLKHDRRWMLVDEQNRFLSQRQLPQMALFDPAITPDGLLIKHRFNNEQILIPFEPQTTELINVEVWDDTCSAIRVSNEADEWFSRLLEVKCHLVYMPDATHRLVDQKYAHNNELTSFADGYPFLLIGQASMDDLNNRLAEAVTVNRFRPSIVFTGGYPFQEDEITHLTINGINFYGVKPCVRCNIPAIDPYTGAIGKEPVKTLAKYRSRNNKIYFGQNLIHNGTGNIHIGDLIEIHYQL
jgi:uncharacterized protein YcbX